jgi:hypothetical protein
MNALYNYSFKGWRALIILCGLLSLADGGLLLAAKMKAYVLVFSEGKVSHYEYISLEKLKINGKNEVRLVNESRMDKKRRFSEKQYKSLKKVGLQSLAKLEVEDGVVYAYLTETSRTACLPDNFKFDNSKMATTAEMMMVMLEGKANGKNSKLIPLSGVEKVYFVAETVSAEEIAFRHASERSEIRIWEIFLRQFPGVRQAEAARLELHKRLLEATRNELDQFQTGQFHSLEAASHHLEQAEVLCPGDPENLRSRQRVDQAKENFQGSLTRGQAYLKQEDYDSALEALGPIALYAENVPELKLLWETAQRESNRQHQEQGNIYLESGQLEEAQREYLVALDRLPNSRETQLKLDEVSIRLGISQVLESMEEKKYVSALAGIEDLLRTYPLDTRLQELAPRVKSARSEQLHSQAKPLLAHSKDTQKDVDKRHLAALKLLHEAYQLCPTAEIASDISLVRRRLSDYYMNHAKQAKEKPRGAGIGSCYLYLARAKFYDPERTGLDELLDRARDDFVKKATFAVAVLVRDKSRTPDSANFAAQLEATVSSTLVNARLPGIWVVERDAIAQIESEEEMLRKLTGNSTQRNLQRTGAMVVVDLIQNSVRSTDQTFHRQSRYVANEYMNREWQQYDANADYYDSLYNQCRKQLGKDHPTCLEHRRQRDYFRRLRGNVPQIIQDIQPYSYLERQVQREASIKVSYRFVDTLTSVRMAQEYLDEGYRATGVEISGAMSRDTNSIQNRSLELPNEYDFLTGLQQRVEQALLKKALDYFRSLHRKYHELAEAARTRNDMESALEYQALFLYTTPDKEGFEAAKAKSFLRESFNLSFDEDLSRVPFRP